MNKPTKLRLVKDDRLWAFAREPDGMVFIFTDDDPVVLLCRASGAQVSMTLKPILNDLNEEQVTRVRDALLLNGIYTDKRYQIMLIGEDT